jgi:zinc/manganese transport system permease protein
MNPLDLVSPFAEFAFMRRALAGALILALASAPIGVFLMLRRMTLTGDAIAHGMLPGVALGFLLAGLSPAAMALGGLGAGLLVALAAGFVSRATIQREETSLAALYLTALALGLVMLSQAASPADVSHILFGSALALEPAGLVLILVAGVLAVLVAALIWPALVLDTVDPAYLRTHGHAGAIAHAAFVFAVVALLVSGFQAVGTLMAVGFLVLPAAAARFWSERLPGMIAYAAGFGAVSAFVGLLLSFHLDAPSGPSMILVAGAIYLGSMALGPAEGLLSRLRPRTHYAS